MAVPDKAFRAVPVSTAADPNRTSLVLAGKGQDGVPSVVAAHYHVLRCIGEGSFGVIYEGESDLNGRRVAIKFESRKANAPQLRDEFRHYKELAGTFGVPAAHHYGAEGAYNCLVLDLLGPSLEELFDRCGRKFTVRTVCHIALQMLDRLQSIHERGLIYRDIKPDNFLVDPPDTTTHQTTIYIVDFGMAKPFIDTKTNQHIPFKDRKALSGTARYMSINTHLGREQSRRDDLESLGHVLFYFLRGSLPWQGLKSASNKEKYEMIGKVKMDTPIDVLCESLPRQFGEYLQYCRQLQFDETPDYEKCRQWFRQVLETLADSDTSHPLFDWHHQKVAVADNKRQQKEVSKRREYRLEQVKESTDTSWFRQWFCFC